MKAIDNFVASLFPVLEISINSILFPILIAILAVGCIAINTAMVWHMTREFMNLNQSAGTRQKILIGIISSIAAFLLFYGFGIVVSVPIAKFFDAEEYILSAQILLLIASLSLIISQYTLIKKEISKSKLILN